MTTVDSHPAHRQVAGWGGGSGECGVECACGTTFDGFDTLAAANEMLDRHIADEPRCPTCGEPSVLLASGKVGHGDDRCTERAEYVAGLRALADMLETHPELELPYTGRGSAIHVIPTGDQRQQLAAWARALGRAEKSPRDEYFDLIGNLHGLKLKVICDRDKVCARVVVATREVVEEVPDPEALAAVRTVTVTKTIEDVEWVCGSLLADTRVGAS